MSPTSAGCTTRYRKMRMPKKIINKPSTTNDQPQPWMQAGVWRRRLGYWAATVIQGYEAIAQLERLCVSHWLLQAYLKSPAKS